jgi:hypothetical protein
MRAVIPNRASLHGDPTITVRVTSRAKPDWYLVIIEAAEIFWLPHANAIYTRCFAQLNAAGALFRSVCRISVARRQPLLPVITAQPQMSSQRTQRICRNERDAKAGGKCP